MMLVVWAAPSILRTLLWRSLHRTKACCCCEVRVGRLIKKGPTWDIGPSRCRTGTCGRIARPHAGHNPGSLGLGFFWVLPAVRGACVDADQARRKLSWSVLRPLLCSAGARALSARR